jgi:hypothetical protein
LILCIAVVSISKIGIVKAVEHVIFEDDFESYTVGTFPSAGGWDLWFNGAGSEYQIIVDPVSASPTKSFQQYARLGWASHTVHPINTEVSVIGYEGYVMVDQNNGAHEASGRLGFSKRDSPSIANWYAHVNFLDDGNISVANPVEPRILVLQSYVTDTWYKVKVILDREDNAYSVWIDDVLRAENISFSYINPYDYDNFGLSATLEGNSKVYFDDVKVFSFFDVNPRLELVPATGIAATTLVGSGFAPNSEISVTWDGNLIPTVPNSLIADSYGSFTGIISVLNQTSSGIYTIKAIDEIGTEANATFTVYSNVSPSSPNPSIGQQSEQKNQYEEVPEFPSWIILPLFLVVTLFGVIIRKKFRGL